ncbi:uncharacterized protein LOC129905896 [Episyrphus balteatus]|uniref:uncharacterized protein LOC129905896 n=1 Tax=Episyrphus balteatus TaxID=286459 RepID=UPI0024854424|nr:uncharacterized protein LOC129905896 [Episyrphus balteatus]
MYFRCVIKMCKSNPNRDEKSTNITFHKFPTDEFKRKKWMEALKLDTIKSSSVICSDHFQPNDFISDSTKNKTRLYPSAVPFLRNDVEESQNCFAIENNSGHQMKIFDTCKPIVRSCSDSLKNPPNSGIKFGDSKPVVWNVKSPLNTGIKFVDSKPINNNVTPNKPQVFFVQPPSASKILPKEDKPPTKPLIVFIDPSSTLSKSGPIFFDPSSSSKILPNDDKNTNKILPAFINPTSTGNILPKEKKPESIEPSLKSKIREEKMKLKIETLKQSESKSRHKVKILHQKIRRHTRSLNCLQQKVSNLKQTLSQRGKRGCLVQNPIKQIKLPKVDNKPTPIPNPPDLTFTNPTHPKVDNKPTPIPNPPDFTFTSPTTSPTTNIDFDQSEELQETANEVSEFDQGRLIFEVNFKNNELFNEYKDFVIEGLRLSLTDKGLFILVEDDTKIQVYREFAVVNEKEENAAESAGTIPNQIGSVVEVKCDSQNLVHNMPKIDDDQETLDNHMPDIDHYQQTLGDPVTKIEVPELQDDIQIAFKNEDIPITGVLTVETQPLEKINSMLIPPKEIIKRTPQQISLLKKRKIQEERERLKQKKPNLNVITNDHNDKRKSINLRPDRYLDHNPEFLDWKSILSKNPLG